ncbi:MAG: ThiF family adenylyltransferase [Leptonema sp. (in: bacteria)]
MDFISQKYLRHQEIHWLDQEELLKSKILIVGMGAIGNELLKNFALLGVGYITLVDFDTIEIHNLTRSVLFNLKDVGKSKVKVAKEKIKKINPDIKLKTYAQDVYDFNFSFFKSFDSIFSVVDNYETRIRLHQLGFLNQIDFFNAGIDSQSISVEYFPYSKNREVCLECQLDPKIYQNIQKRYSCGWIQRHAFKQKKIPTTILTSSFAASFLSSLFVQRKEYREPIRIFLNTKSWNFSYMKSQKNENCYFCKNWKNPKWISKTKFLNTLSSLSETTTIFCNEPILISIECSQCHSKEFIFELSRKFTDKDLYCKKCGSKIQNVIVQDSFLKNEIENIKKLQWKYLYYFDNKKNQTFLIPNND